MRADGSAPKGGGPDAQAPAIAGPRCATCHGRGRDRGCRAAGRLLSRCEWRRPRESGRPAVARGDLAPPHGLDGADHVHGACGSPWREGRRRRAGRRPAQGRTSRHAATATASPIDPDHLGPMPASGRLSGAAQVRLRLRCASCAPRLARWLARLPPSMRARRTPADRGAALACLLRAARLGRGQDPLALQAGQGRQPLRREPEHDAPVAHAARSSASSTSRPPRHPKFDCFYVYPTVSDQKTAAANFHIDPGAALDRALPGGALHERLPDVRPRLPAEHARQPARHRSRATPEERALRYATCATPGATT